MEADNEKPLLEYTSTGSSRKSTPFINISCILVGIPMACLGFMLVTVSLPFHGQHNMHWGIFAPSLAVGVGGLFAVSLGLVRFMSQA